MTRHRSVQRLLQVLVLLLTGLALASPALAGEPKLSRILPRGARRGSEVEVTLSGDYLRETLDILFTGPGIQLLSVEESKDKSARVRLRIAEDCPLGLHALRVRTRTGLSNLRTFSVGALQEIAEADNNDSLATAQLVPLQSTLTGVANNEDVDYYAFEGKKDQRVSAEIEGLRLGDTLFDPSIAILDEGGFELASCDDIALLRQDSCVTVTLPEDGRYYLRVRECSYRGNGNCRYRLHLGTFPRPLALFPAGGAPGTELTARVIGADVPDAEIKIRLPENGQAVSASSGWSARGVHPVFFSDDQGSAPSPNWVRVTDLPSTIEVEPNSNSKTATLAVIPGALDGILAEPGDRDFYSFEAKKNEQFHIRVFARSLRSPLDAVITIRDPKGKYLKANDDSGGPDSYLRFKMPSDGLFTLEVRDQLNAGGAHYVYRVEFHRIKPAIWLEAPRDRQTLAVPQGGRTVLMLTADRMDCGAGFEASLPELPPGVSAEIAPIAPGVSTFPVVLTATADAELGQGLTPVTLKLIDDDGNATRAVEGGYRQDVELVLGRNNRIFWAHSVDRLPIAVVAPAPFSIQVVENKAPLVQNGAATLHVKLTRSEKFKGKVKLRVPFAPPGVNARQNMTIEADQTELHIPIDARGNARIGDWSLVVEAIGYPGQGPLRVSSTLVPLKVRAPFVTFTVQATSVERGQATALHIDIKKLEGFKGTAQVALGGLPHHVSAEDITLNAESESLDFDIATQGDSPLGRFKQLFCTARFETEEGVVMHRLPAAELLINAPPKNAVAAAPKPKPVKKKEPKAAKPKPLTRLEKLRLQHDEAIASRASAATAAATEESAADKKAVESAQVADSAAEAAQAKKAGKPVAAPANKEAATPATQEGKASEQGNVLEDKSPKTEMTSEEKSAQAETKKPDTKEAEKDPPTTPETKKKESAKDSAGDTAENKTKSDGEVQS